MGSRRSLAGRMAGAALLAAVTGCSVMADGACREWMPIEAAVSGHAFSGPYTNASQLVFVSPRRTLLFGSGSRKLLVDGVLVWLSYPVAPTAGVWRVSGIDADAVLRPLLRSPDCLEGLRARVVAIDPGHGGTDTGAALDGWPDEKVVVLDIATRVRRLLHDAPLKVRLTRSGDRTLTLRQRVQAAADCRADLLVSIHANAAANLAARGIESYTLPPTGAPTTHGGAADETLFPGARHVQPSLMLAYQVHRAALGATQAADRGIKRARYQILREAPCPALLFECGFLSNAEEAACLADTDYREKLAAGIAAGIRAYAARVEEYARNRGE